MAWRAICPDLYRRLGCEVSELFCEVDGNFPNHHPDPSQPANLQDVIAAGWPTATPSWAWRLTATATGWGVVTKDGQIIYPDRQLLLFAADVLARNPGAKIIYDVKSTAIWRRGFASTAASRSWRAPATALSRPR